MAPEYCANHDNNSDSRVNCVNKVPIFNHLTHEEMQEIAQVAQSKSYEKGERLNLSRASADTLFIIHKGSMKIYRLSESGREQVVRILKPGDFMGELSLFGGGTQNSYAEALEPTELCRILGRDLKELLKQFPEIAIKILEEFSQRLERAEAFMEQIGQQSVDQRLADNLLKMAQNVEENRDGESTIILPMSKGDLASMIGTSQETLSRKLSEFRDRGWLELNGQREIRILDKKALKNLQKE